MARGGRWLNTFVTDTATDTQTPAQQWQTYHERRELAVVQPLGSLALVNTQVVDSEQTIWGVPGRWAPLPEGESGLKVIAEAADGIHVDGVLVDGEAIVRGKDHANPSEIVFSPTRRADSSSRRRAAATRCASGMPSQRASRTSEASTRSTTTRPG